MSNIKDSMVPESGMQDYVYIYKRRISKDYKIALRKIQMFAMNPFCSFILRLTTGVVIIIFLPAEAIKCIAVTDIRTEFGNICLPQTSPLHKGLLTAHQKVIRGAHPSLS